MPKHRHRLLTRWFSRRIDLGVVLAGCLFVYIWVLLPHDQASPDAGPLSTGMFVQVTTASLSSLPAYLRPDLMLIPSRYSFRPRYDMPDLLSRVPRYSYTKQTNNCIGAEAVGMGQLADLSASITRNYQSLLLIPSVMHQSAASRANVQESKLHVKMSAGLHPTRLRTDVDLWASVRDANQHWNFSFWIAFDDEALEYNVFVEDRSGDASLDSDLLGIVRRLDVWENPVGSGRVWLWYVPEKNPDTEIEK